MKIKDINFSLIRAIFIQFYGLWNVTIMGIILSTLRRISNSKLCEINRVVITPFFCRLIIMSVGMKVEMKGLDRVKDKQAIFMYNHNSFFDIFILPLTKLKNMRYIFTEKALGILGLRLANYGNEALLLPSLTQNAKLNNQRDQKFKEFSNLLKTTNISILTAPEGQHTFEHRIDIFNDGVFIMATESQVDIIPVFIQIAKDNNPFQGYRFKSGTIIIEFMEPIKTIDWKIEQLEQNKKSVRDIFVKRFNKAHNTTIV
jgi:1-acyl-sn-glycerol-3-phosphate acyltransferase